MPDVKPTLFTMFDQVDDWPETCWIEASVDEDEARDILAQYCSDENCHAPFRPVGPASREWHRPTGLIVPNGETWEKCEPTDDGAIEFWKVEVF